MELTRELVPKMVSVDGIDRLGPQFRTDVPDLAGECQLAVRATLKGFQLSLEIGDLRIERVQHGLHVSTKRQFPTHAEPALTQRLETATARNHLLRDAAVLQCHA